MGRAERQKLHQRGKCFGRPVSVTPRGQVDEAHLRAMQEHAARQQVFQSNLELIKKHNSEDHSYKVQLAQSAGILTVAKHCKALQRVSG